MKPRFDIPFHQSPAVLVKGTERDRIIMDCNNTNLTIHFITLISYLLRLNFKESKFTLVIYNIYNGKLMS
jgi:hypothetical protein